MKKFLSPPLLFSALLFTVSAQVAFAGTYNPVSVPVGPSVTTGCANTINGLTNNGVDYSLSDSDPKPNANGVWGYKQSNASTYEWEWVPNGLLKDDPAPAKDMVHTYTFTGGYIKAKITGRARAQAYAEFSPGGSFTAGLSFGYPETVPLPAGNQVDTFSLQAPPAMTTRLAVGVTLRARSSTYLLAATGGTASTEFGGNSVGLQTGGVTLARSCWKDEISP